MVASTKTDKKLGTVNIPHEGPEEYNNIWQKVRSMWSYIYDNYYEKVRGHSMQLLVRFCHKMYFTMNIISSAVRLFPHRGG
jgi:hypothetical protein